MTSTDASRAKLQAIINRLQTFAATLTDVADVQQVEDSQSWRLSVTPHVATACPIEMMIQADEIYAVQIDGEGVEDQPLADDTPLLPIFEAVADGRVIRRVIRSEVTGLAIDIQTRIAFDDGGEWVLSRTPEIADGLHPTLDMPTVATDQHYLPYARPTTA